MKKEVIDEVIACQTKGEKANKCIHDGNLSDTSGFSKHTGQIGARSIVAAGETIFI